MSGNAYSIVKKPVLTEKTTWSMNEQGRYCFEVDRDATKPEIKRAVEDIYSVHVVSIQTVVKKGRDRRNRYGIVKGKLVKKATVRLRDGERIELF